MRMNKKESHSISMDWGCSCNLCPPNEKVQNYKMTFLCTQGRGPLASNRAVANMLRSNPQSYLPEGLSHYDCYP